MKRHLFPAILLMLGWALDAQGQTLKPGLWELSQKMQSDSADLSGHSAQMQKKLAAMSPEQRKMMLDVLALSAPPVSVKVCMTKEMIERNEVATSDADCKSRFGPRVGSTMKFSIVCERPPSSGDGVVSFVSPEAYTSTMNANVIGTGKNEKLSVEGQGKWLSAECGAVMPPRAAKKKAG